MKKIINEKIEAKEMLTSNNSKRKIVDYLKNNNHAYVCSSKVGSSVIREIFTREISMPFLYNKQNQLKKRLERRGFGLSKAAKEPLPETKKRKMLFLVRCPFHRAVSSYEYLKDERFDSCKKMYLRKNIDLDKMGIMEYIKFMKDEIENGEYNAAIEHFYPQKRSFQHSAIPGTKIDLLWQGEKIDKLLEALNKAFNLRINVKQKRNVNITNRNIYTDYYLKYPELFNLVKETFREDLGWLNPLFDYENNFKSLLKLRRKKTSKKSMPKLNLLNKSKGGFANSDLNEGSPILVSSYGGCGTTFFVKFLQKKGIWVRASERIKHIRRPPRNQNISKAIYIYGDPRDSVLSFFRKKEINHKFLKRHCTNIQGDIKNLNFKNSLREYLEKGKDIFRLEEHFDNWNNAKVNYPILFVRYEKLWDNLDKIFEFLDIPKEEIKDFPRKIRRSSNWKKIPKRNRQMLNKIYGRFARRLDKIESIYLLNNQASRHIASPSIFKKMILGKNILGKSDKVIEVKDFKGLQSRSLFFRKKLLGPRLYLDNILANFPESMHEVVGSANQSKLDAISKGKISAFDPYTGEVAYSSNSYFTENFIWYEFGGKKKFYLAFLNKRPFRGNPKYFLWLDSEKILFKADILSVEKKEVENFYEDLKKFKSFLVKNAKGIAKYRIKDKKNSILINSIDSIFHYFWNDMPGIEFFLKEGGIKDVDKIIIRNDFFDFKKLFPEIPEDKIEYLESNRELDLQKKIIKDNLFIVNFQGNIISDKTIERIKKYSLDIVDKEFKNKYLNFKNKHKIAIAITIRDSQIKTWENQLEGLAKIIKKLSKNYPDIGFVLNGFSSAGDRNDNNCREIIKSQKKFVNRLLKELKSIDNIFDTVGCSIEETIFLSYNVDMYLSVHGSQQHKWGWFGNTPGVIHGPPARQKNLENAIRSKLKNCAPTYVIESPLFALFIPSRMIKPILPKKPSKTINVQTLNYNFDWRLAYKRLDFLIKKFKENPKRSVREWNEIVLNYKNE